MSGRFFHLFAAPFSLGRHFCTELQTPAGDTASLDDSAAGTALLRPVMVILPFSWPTVLLIYEYAEQALLHAFLDIGRQPAGNTIDRFFQSSDGQAEVHDILNTS